MLNELLQLMTRCENAAEAIRESTIKTHEYAYRCYTADIIVKASGNISETDRNYRKVTFDSLRAFSDITALCEALSKRYDISVYVDRYVHIHVSPSLYDLLGDYMFTHNIGHETTFMGDGIEHRALDYNTYVTVYDCREEKEAEPKEEVAENDDF